MVCSLPGSACSLPGKNLRMGCRFLLQGIVLTQGLKLGLPHCRQILHHLSHQGTWYLHTFTFYILISLKHKSDSMTLLPKIFSDFSLHSSGWNPNSSAWLARPAVARPCHSPVLAHSSVLWRGTCQALLLRFWSHCSPQLEGTSSFPSPRWTLLLSGSETPMAITKPGVQWCHRQSWQCPRCIWLMGKMPSYRLRRRSVQSNRIIMPATSNLKFSGNHNNKDQKKQVELLNIFYLA